VSKFPNSELITRNEKGFDKLTDTQKKVIKIERGGAFIVASIKGCSQNMLESVSHECAGECEGSVSMAQSEIINKMNISVGRLMRKA
jgi:hypothetical protein